MHTKSCPRQLQSDIASIQDAQQSTLTSISDEAARVSRAETELSAIRDAADANTQDVGGFFSNTVILHRP